MATATTDWQVTGAALFSAIVGSFIPLLMYFAGVNRRTAHHPRWDALPQSTLTRREHKVSGDTTLGRTPHERHRPLPRE